MKAVWFERLGTARDVLKLGDMPVPEPGAGEVLIRIMASGLNPSDIKRRSGWGGIPLAFPKIVPHQDGAGVVERVGAEVKHVKPGERVWCYMAQIGRPFGTAAQYAVLPASRVVALPENTSFDEGAGLGVPAMTALGVLTSIGEPRGKHVLVRGGTGAVGFYAIQSAKELGAASVATTVSSGTKEALVREIGADRVFRRDRREAPVGRYDLIVEVDLGGNVNEDLELINTEGVIISFSSNEDAVLRWHTALQKSVIVQAFLVYNLPADKARRITDMISATLKDGKLRHNRIIPMPLAECVAAHERQERSSGEGKIVLHPWA